MRREEEKETGYVLLLSTIKKYIYDPSERCFGKFFLFFFNLSKQMHYGKIMQHLNFSYVSIKMKSNHHTQ